MRDQIVAVFGSSGTTPAEPDWADGVRCGRLLAESGLGVATGGYGGLMEAVSEGAADNGVRVIGVTAPSVFPDRDSVNRHVTEVIETDTLTERVHHLLAVSDAAIVLPGSIGTLTELVAAWNSAFVTRFSGERPKPLAVVGPKWAGIIRDLTRSLETDDTLVICAPHVDDAVSAVTAALAQQG